MRKRRTFYFNDARHYYLFVFEPPMQMEDAWLAIDEVAGTAVDSFSYGVERGDGLFYPSKVGMRFGADIQPFEHVAYWRVWNNMQSLIDRGLDPLTVLIDRAHDKGMDFFASLRMASYGGMDAAFRVPEGRGLAHQEVRDHQLAVLEELVADYPTDGIELDFAAAPGGAPLALKPEDVEEYTPVLTDYVRQIAEMTRSRSNGEKLVGARVYPTEEINRSQGLDVRQWLEQGLIDYVVGMLYIDFKLDPNMPIDWLVEAAHAADISVYGMLQPFVRDESSGSPDEVYAPPAATRAAAANYWAKGVDGLYTWFLRWPLQDAARGTLTEIGDPDLIAEASKCYVQRRRLDEAVEMGYDAHLPLSIPTADPQVRYAIPFYIADDFEGAGGRIRQVQLRLRIQQIVSADRLTILLNGESLEGELCRRDYGHVFGPYEAQWLEFELEKVRPRQGENTLEISLDSRPEGLASGISVDEMEVYVEYGSYASKLNP
jgi:hypothetical protein